MRNVPIEFKLSGVSVSEEKPAVVCVPFILLCYHRGSAFASTTSWFVSLPWSIIHPLSATFPRSFVANASDLVSLVCNLFVG